MPWAEAVAVVASGLQGGWGAPLPARDRSIAEAAAEHRRKMDAMAAETRRWNRALLWGLGVFVMTTGAMVAQWLGG